MIHKKVHEFALFGTEFLALWLNISVLRFLSVFQGKKKGDAGCTFCFFLSNKKRLCDSWSVIIVVNEKGTANAVPGSGS